LVSNGTHTTEEVLMRLPVVFVRELAAAWGHHVVVLQ
jgi:hypothetical protein